MNTIQINTPEGTVNYTEAEVIRFIEKAKEVDDAYAKGEQYRKETNDNRYKVRDFFSEGEWDDNETTVNKGDVNLLLESIGANKLTSKFRGTFTVTGTFSVEVEEEDEVTDLVTDNISVDFYGGDIDVEQIEVLDIEEDN